MYQMNSSDQNHISIITNSYEHHNLLFKEDINVIYQISNGSTFKTNSDDEVKINIRCKDNNKGKNQHASSL